MSVNVPPSPMHRQRSVITIWGTGCDDVSVDIYGSAAAHGDPHSAVDYRVSWTHCLWTHHLGLTAWKTWVGTAP